MHKDEWEEHMKKILSIGFVCAGFILAFACYAGSLDDVLKGVKIPQIRRQWTG